MLQTLKGREDPRNKADNPNPIPVLNIFARICKGTQHDLSLRFSLLRCLRRRKLTSVRHWKLAPKQGRGDGSVDHSLQKFVKGNMNTFIIFLGVLLLSSASDLLKCDFTLSFCCDFLSVSTCTQGMCNSLIFDTDHPINLLSIAPEHHDHSNSTTTTTTTTTFIYTFSTMIVTF